MNYSQQFSYKIFKRNRTLLVSVLAQKHLDQLNIIKQLNIVEKVVSKEYFSFYENEVYEFFFCFFTYYLKEVCLFLYVLSENFRKISS